VNWLNVVLAVALAPVAVLLLMVSGHFVTKMFRAARPGPAWTALSVTALPVLGAVYFVSGWMVP
jgi:hypothetical protein